MPVPKLPKVDSDYTMAELHEEAARFIEAGKRYWTAMHKAGIGGALAWVEFGADGLVIYTRGEYRETLLRNIPEVGPVHHFGAADDEGSY